MGTRRKRKNLHKQHTKQPLVAEHSVALLLIIILSLRGSSTRAKRDDFEGKLVKRVQLNGVRLVVVVSGIAVFRLCMYDTLCMYVCMYVFMVITYGRVWINRVRLPILLVVS